MIRPILVQTAVPGDENTARRRRVRSVALNVAESPLGWLKARGKISDRQYRAGETLRRDYERANLPPRVTMNWDAQPKDKNRRGPQQPGASTIIHVSAKRRFHAAIESAGPGLADMLWRVVCAGETVPIAEREMGWPNRSGRVVLGLALDRVAGYYRVG